MLAAIMGTLHFSSISIADDKTARTAPVCEIDRPVRIAGLDWDSDRFHAAVASFIITHGFGCRTEIIHGTTIPLLTGLGRGDVDIMMEVWKDQLTQAWEKAEKAGTVRLLGTNYPDAIQGWFVPRYLVEGGEAPAKGLKHVDDLPRFASLFRDPEEPSKGRFYNCKLGWDCETINTKKLGAYGLNKYFTNFRSGSGAGLSAAIASAYKRKKPILYYYWGPTWIMAKYDAVMLKEPDYDPEIWAEMTKREKPLRATAAPVIAVYTGANTQFIANAPKIAQFLRNYQTSNQLVSEALLYLQNKSGAKSEAAAINFLKTKTKVWENWLPKNIKERVEAALAAR